MEENWGNEGIGDLGGSGGSGGSGQRRGGGGGTQLIPSELTPVGMRIEVGIKGGWGKMQENAWKKGGIGDLRDSDEDEEEEEHN